MRFTPTCVGKSSANVVVAHSLKRFTPTCVGKSAGVDHAAACDRFTPTCVGKSLSSLAALPVDAVHPHVCGEIMPGVSMKAVTPGSPPRVWGNLEAPPSARPTCTGSPPRVCGKSVGLGSQIGNCSVHPHVCGEIGVSSTLGRTFYGSPPRVWGNHPFTIEQLPQHRFTPTCVGKSRCGNLVGASVAVHPHVCGEITAAVNLSLAAAGSPPRVWGNHVAVSLCLLVHRFAPTCVGKSGFATSGKFCRGGSPPRVWGNHALADRRHRSQRFTPTCVGKSRVT